MSRLVRRIAAATALVLTVPLGAAFGAPSTVGSVGIGDPYYPDYGNGGYDVSHYAIDIDYTPSSDTVAGTTTITATTTQALSRFDLDFVLPVSAVTVNGSRATYHQTRHELVVRPADELVAGAGMRVEVTYRGVPSKVSDGRISPWIRTKDGAAAVGEPEIAAWWFPSDDHPRDKATYDVSVTVPRSLEVVSNGVLVSSDATADRRTWHWREDVPMASYLADFVAGQLDITSTTHDGLPVVTAVASGGGAPARYAAADLARTPQVIDFEQGLWGPYPFDAMGGVAPAADFGFALENQTRPVYSRLFWTGGPDIYVVVHELAHQWYGDSVSVENWRDIWLNEGFATFTEWMWSEKHGQGSAARLFDATYHDYPARSSFWKTPIGNPGAGREFVDAVYDRGAMTLQALRTRIGDADFFTTMRQWAASRAYSNGSIADFIALAEKVSGDDLDSFFQAWLYSPTRPPQSVANGFPARAGARSRSAVAEPTPASLARIRATDRMLAARMLAARR